MGKSTAKTLHPVDPITAEVAKGYGVEPAVGGVDVAPEPLTGAIAKRIAAPKPTTQVGPHEPGTQVGPRKPGTQVGPRKKKSNGKQAKGKSLLAED
jgi:hypothetical protein